MHDVSFEISGYEGNPSGSTDESFFNSLLDEIRQSIKKTIGPFKCMKHGGTPSVVVKVDRMHRMSFDVSGCCDDLVRVVRKKIG